MTIELPACRVSPGVARSAASTRTEADARAEIGRRHQGEEPWHKCVDEATAEIAIHDECDLLAALKAAEGYLLNARIDLETGAPKRTAITTIDGGLKRVRAAIAKADGRAP